MRAHRRGAPIHHKRLGPRGFMRRREAPADPLTRWGHTVLLPDGQPRRVACLQHGRRDALQGATAIDLCPVAHAGRGHRMHRERTDSAVEELGVVQPKRAGTCRVGLRWVRRNDLQVRVWAEREDGVVRAKAWVHTSRGRTHARRALDGSHARVEVAARVHQVVDSTDAPLAHSPCSRRAWEQPGVDLLSSQLRVAAERQACDSRNPKREQNTPQEEVCNVAGCQKNTKTKPSNPSCWLPTLFAEKHRAENEGDQDQQAQAGAIRHCWRLGGGGDGARSGRIGSRTARSWRSAGALRWHWLMTDREQAAMC